MAGPYHIETYPEVLAQEVLNVLLRVLGCEIRALIAHGSWVHGDFAAGRSDLDLLAVLTEDPSREAVADLAPLLHAVIARHPQWTDRLEVGLVSPTAVRDVVMGTGRTHVVGRLSPGEPLHLVEADLHRLLDWEAATRGRLVWGEEGLLPPVPPALVRRVLEQHLRSWPTWVKDMDGEGLAYAVLTVCRAAACLATGAPHSKRQGGRWVAERHPALARLVAEADVVWYEPGKGHTLDREEAIRFVSDFAPRASRARPD